MPEHPSDRIAAALAVVVADEKVMRDGASSMFHADSRRLYPFDFWAAAAVNRSLAVSAGFRRLIRDQNLICAGALLRLHLDTAMRLMAGFIVERPHDFATEVMGGSRINKMKDRCGSRMTDRYLLTQLAREYPWVESVYERTSDYVHFSATHIFSMADMQGNSDGPTYGNYILNCTKYTAPLLGASGLH